MTDTRSIASVPALTERGNRFLRQFTTNLRAVHNCLQATSAGEAALVGGERRQARGTCPDPGAGASRLRCGLDESVQTVADSCPVARFVM